MKYNVNFWYTEFGQTQIEADTPEQAEQILYNRLADYGLEDLEYRCNDRDYGTQDAEDVTV